jgi:hypothetical protein
LKKGFYSRINLSFAQKNPEPAKKKPFVFFAVKKYHKGKDLYNSFA